MKNQRGMSLVELLISMVILAIVILAVAKYIQTQTQMVRQQEMLTNTQQNVRAAMDVMTRDLRSAEYDNVNDPKLSPFRVFAVAETSRCIFYTDINGNGQIDVFPNQQDVNEVKGFRWQAGWDDMETILTQGPPEQWQTLARNIQRVDFGYYDSAGAAIPNPATARGRSIFAVKVRIIGIVPRDWSASVKMRPTRELSGMVQIRSRQGI